MARKRSRSPEDDGRASEAERRRVLRRCQRELRRDIVDIANAGGCEGGRPEEELGRLRRENNELWRGVRNTREAVLDSDNVGLITDMAAAQADRLVQAPRYDPISLAQSFAKRGAVRDGPSSRFDWRGLGFQVGVCFNSLPPDVSFLRGPIDAEREVKERKKPQRRERQPEVESDDDEDEKPEDVDQSQRKRVHGDELSAVERHIEVIKETLARRAGEERESALKRADDREPRTSDAVGDERAAPEEEKKSVGERSQVNAVNCLFNPRSFTQTVENVFHFSFLVKQGMAGIKVRNAEDARGHGVEPGPVIRPVRDEAKRLGPPRQAIVSLSMKDWRDLCEAYGVERSDVPHRADGKVVKSGRKGKKSEEQKLRSPASELDSPQAETPLQ